MVGVVAQATTPKKKILTGISPVCHYINRDDIAERLCRHKRHWFHGNPKIKLSGNEKEFGKLVFDFGDEIITFGVYIKCSEYILYEAHLAIENFDEIITSKWY